MSDKTPPSVTKPPGEAGTPYHTEDLSVLSLRVGMRLAQDIHDQANVLLLAAGMPITPRFLELLSQREIRTVRLCVTTPAARAAAAERAGHPGMEIDNDASRRMDELLPRALRDTPPFHPVRSWRRPRLTMAALRKEASRGLHRHTATSQVLAGLGESLQVGGEASLGGLRRCVHEFVDMVSMDFDLLPLIVSLQRTQDEYLYDHCVNVSLLAMTISAQLGLNVEQTKEVGLAALLHDIGMLRVPGRIRLAPRPLSPGERREIERHPHHTMDLLEGVRGLPVLVKLIGFQAHERQDGSGYPRQQKGAMVHPFASIVAIADMYAAMTRPRPYRPAMSPYEATRTILFEASGDRLDRGVVRAFLDAVSLFPIGSVVELSDGQKARVLRANTSLHTRPQVEMLDDHDKPTGQIVDMAKVEGIRVVKTFDTQRPIPLLPESTQTEPAKAVQRTTT